MSIRPAKGARGLKAARPGQRAEGTPQVKKRVSITVRVIDKTRNKRAPVKVIIRPLRLYHI
jgi:hypothetical protein